MQKTLISVLWALWAVPALSATVTIEVDSKNTGFHHEPYYVVYLADTRGKFIRTLRVFGVKRAYQKSLRTWYRNAKRAGENIDALSGASLRRGNAYTGDFEIADSYIAKGYKLVLETSSENKGNKRQEIVITLDASKPVQTGFGNDHTDYMTVTLK